MRLGHGIVHQDYKIRQDRLPQAPFEYYRRRLDLRDAEKVLHYPDAHPDIYGRSCLY